MHIKRLVILNSGCYCQEWARQISEAAAAVQTGRQGPAEINGSIPAYGGTP